ncbi:DUF4115 domain-containing protein [Dasania sp. GY-MA-18]|uniref:DUF4115 domain-containing protein n=1 Tax=Dasania phycosphaerae TaxID=2950436 RepID=A0A9J6RRW4_9GAMM|nr:MULTISPECIES: RodZ domain-containing protein [Dasania]MCR8924168.1 DUF4115 domain-containing protein [Dasania sp. GY-MA-18]MCZ0866821.1 DUF4115 domain-containing protein [Dasania phycosphaerae]MCZ0870326.1 DUF4115 domain-containing protein [Dasania phycosphaerae]
MEVNQEVSGMIDELVRESIGEQLRKAREKKGLSTSAAADSLRIMAYQIEALEQENFSCFKADVFIRSYLRNYAQLLGVDTQALLAQYQQEHFVERAAPIINRPKPVHLPCKKRYLGIVAVLVVIVGLWLDNREQAASDNAPAATPLAEIEDAGLNANAQVQPNEASDAALAPVNSAAENPVVAVEPLLTAEAEPAIAAELDVDSIIAEAVSVLPEHQLELNFSAECWVEIKDAEGKTLVADLKRKGDQVLVEGAAPFNIILGYAPAVALRYNGEAVEINTNTRTQAARLVVGRS